MRITDRVRRLEALAGPGDPGPALSDDELLDSLEDILRLERGAIPRDVCADLAPWNEARGYVDRDDPNPERRPAECVFDAIVILAAEKDGCPRAEMRAAFGERFNEARRW